MISQSYRRAAAFTLIELLVVVGIIALLAGVIGMALRGGDSGTALRASQSTLFSLVASARGQAILSQGTARVLVYADPADPSKNLRYLQVAYTADAVPTATSVWTTVGDGVTLPGGVYVVPPTGMSLTTGTASYTHVSDLIKPAIGMIIPPSTTASTDFYYIEFSQLGTPAVTSGSNYGTFVLSTAVPDPSTSQLLPQFNNPLNIRGLMLRKLGSSTLLNTADDF
ncbi:MAG: prepilin-type N-terminal cleavage/methylation domain-containing protein [Opitutaceae bacterium]